jgi:hypothetical protein
VLVSFPIVAALLYPISKVNVLQILMAAPMMPHTHFPNA